MDVLELVARLALSAVFLVAGVGKLADLRGSRTAVAGFGLPDALAAPVGVALPVTELAVALALLFNPTVPFAAIAAAALLAAFVTGIAVNLRRGNTPDCHCFGRLHSEPIGRGVLVRNSVLLVIAVAVAAVAFHTPGIDLALWISGLQPVGRALLMVGVLATIGLATEGYLLHTLRQQNLDLTRRLDAMDARVGGSGAAPASYGLPVGTVAPPFTLDGLFGERITLASLTARGRDLLLVFASPDCVPCTQVLPDVAAWQREYADDLTVAVISTGDAAANGAKMTEFGIAGVLIQKGTEVGDAYRYEGTPSAVFVTRDGRIGSELAVGPDTIRALMRSWLDGGAPAAPDAGAADMPGPAIGEPAPDPRLLDINGVVVRPSDFRGHEVMLIFWNTGCSFCRAMLDDLRAWEARRPADAPEIVVFSAGSVDEVRALALRSTVLLDPDSAGAQAFGATGTPMAVLLDREGRIASDLVVGAAAILALAPGGSMWTADTP